MQPLVQSAIDAIHQGDKPKAIELIRQVLSTTPNDVDAWLVLATVLDDPQRKRQCLNRVLTIDPTNKLARDELLEMDRAHMSAPPSQEVVESFSTAPSLAYTPPLSSSPFPDESAREPEQPQLSDQPAAPKRTPSPQPVVNPRLAKPLVFKFPLFWRILMIVFLLIFGCSGLLIATQNVINSLPFLGLALLIGLSAMAVSPKVEISAAGIRAASTFSSSEAKWDEIVRMKSNPMKRRLELYKKNGDVVSVSTQVSKYASIVEIIRQTRPDLFAVAGPSVRGVSSDRSSTDAIATPTFTKRKIFRKNAFAQYGVILLMIPLCLFGLWTLVMTEEAFVGIGVILVGLFFMVMSLFTVNQLKVEPGKITTESFFSQKEYTAKQIRDIQMKTVRSRHGIATSFVSVQPVEGVAIRLAGFTEGDEVLYGVLRDWWETHGNR
jgi:hypothetical protein